METPIPWGRSIASVLALAAFLIGLFIATRWWKWRAICADAETTVLAVLPDAFGTTATFQADFRPRYGFTCNEMLVVEHNLSGESGDDVTAIVEGVEAELLILDEHGEPVLRSIIIDASFIPTSTEPGADAVLPAFLFDPVLRGEYQLRITVHTPAGVLSGVPHRVVARHELCGIEYLGVVYLGGIALAALFVSGALTIGIVLVTRSRRRLANTNVAPAW